MGDASKADCLTMMFTRRVFPSVSFVVVILFSSQDGRSGLLFHILDHSATHRLQKHPSINHPGIR